MSIRLHHGKIATGALMLLLTFVLAGGVEAQRPRAAKPADAKKDEKKEEDKKDEKEFWLHVTNVEVHPVVGPVMQNAEIMCRDGKIVAIGNDLAKPDTEDEKVEYETLDGQGMRAYPGVIALNGAGLIPRMAGKAGDNTDPRGFMTEVVLAHGITTTVTGSTAVKLDANATNEAVLRQGLFRGLQYSSRNPQQKRQLREALEKARAFIRATKSGASDDEKKKLQKELGAGAGYIPLLEGKQIALFNVEDRQAIVEVCELVETFAFRAVLRGAAEGWTVPGRLGRAKLSVVLTPRARRDPNENLMRESGGVASNAATLWNHGVQVAIATGSSRIDFDAQPGRDALGVTWDAGHAVSGGLPEKAAIEAITLTAARVYGLDDRIGSLEVGKDADIIITDGELLHYETMVQWAVVNGRVSYDKAKSNAYRHIRPRDGVDEDKGRNWWPRRVSEMPEDWAFDAMAEAKKRREAAKPAEEKAEDKKADDTKAKKKSDKKADGDKKSDKKPEKKPAPKPPVEEK